MSKAMIEDRDDGAADSKDANNALVAKVDTPGEEGREKWGRQMDFLLACVGYAIGLGNVWRFPYMCFKNGGGAFLIPYLLSVLLNGMPLFLLETSLGQFCSVGGLGIWKICPIFKGVGWATAVCACLLNIYYIVVIAWALFYLIASFSSELPWGTCGNWWNTDFCYVAGEKGAISANVSTSIQNMSTTVVTELSNNTTALQLKVSSVDEYWNRNILQITDGIEEVGTVRWQLALTLIVAWVLCYFCIWKGVKQTGKVVYFTALFPYVIMFILLIRGVTLEGSAQGIMFYITPNFTTLQNPKVWLDAGSQVFFSYGVALGALVAMGSYNTYHNNVYRDAVMVCCINSGTSIFSGFVIFSVLGFMANEQGVDVRDVADGGPGLLFIAYPKALTMMPFPQVWAVLFFCMVLFLGLDSQFCTMEGFITAIVDEFSKYLMPIRAIFILFVCVVSYLLGLLCVTQGGMYVFELMNTFGAAGYVLLLMAFIEIISVSWCFGVKNFYLVLEDMIGYRPPYWWYVCWLVISPMFCMMVLIFSLVYYSRASYGNDYIYPIWAEFVGWMMVFSAIVCIPAYAIYKVYVTEGSGLIEKIKNASKPAPEIEVVMVRIRKSIAHKRAVEAAGEEGVLMTAADDKSNNKYDESKC